MPAFLKTKKDEELWTRAKAAHKKSKGVASNEKSWKDKDWAIVTTIWKSMKGVKASVRRRNAMSIIENLRESAGNKLQLTKTDKGYESDDKQVKFVLDAIKLHGRWEALRYVADHVAGNKKMAHLSELAGELESTLKLNPKILKEVHHAISRNLRKSAPAKVKDKLGDLLVLFHLK